MLQFKNVVLSNLFKILFLLFLLIGFTYTSFFTINHNTHKKLTLALDMEYPLSSVNPSRINVLSEAIVLRNLYSPLFEYDENQNIVSGLIKSFQWKNGTLKFDLISEPVLSNGKKISLDDVLFSLKRLMFLGDNLHGDLKEILCPDVKLNNINDDCPGLNIVDQTIELTPKTEVLGRQLIPLLATVDFRIIPRESIDETTPSLPIINFEVTTGPYFSTSYDEKGNFNLIANRHHYKYSPDMPQEIDVLSLTGNAATKKFIDGSIDVISTSVAITNEEFQHIKKSVDDLSLAKSFNLKIKAIFFGKKAMEDFSAEQRFAVAKKLRVFYDKIILPLEVPSVEFFQDFASGYLNDEQKISIQKLRDQNSSINDFSRKITLAINRKSIDRWKNFLSENKLFEADLMDTSAFHLTIENRPDVFAGVNDVTFNKSISVLSYNLKQGILGAYGAGATQWLKKYTNANSTNTAINILNELHYDAISKCAIYPLAVAPYILLSRNGWKARINPYFSSTELWLLRRY